MIIILFCCNYVLGSKNGSSPAFNIASAAPFRRTRADDFLNADNDKSDYDW